MINPEVMTDERIQTLLSNTIEIQEACNDLLKASERWSKARTKKTKDKAMIQMWDSASTVSLHSRGMNSFLKGLVSQGAIRNK